MYTQLMIENYQTQFLKKKIAGDLTILSPLLAGIPWVTLPTGFVIIFFVVFRRRTNYGTL